MSNIDDIIKAVRDTSNIETPESEPSEDQDMFDDTEELLHSSVTVRPLPFLHVPDHIVVYTLSLMLLLGTQFI